MQDTNSKGDIGSATQTAGDARPGRVKWVDYAKGICIIFVVMVWSTLDYGYTVGAEGWLHAASTRSRARVLRWRPIRTDPCAG